MVDFNLNNRAFKFRFFCIALILILMLFYTFWWAGYRYNATVSLPIGWYKLISIETQSQLKKGVWIAFCPPSTQAFEKNNFGFVPQNGICPNGYRMLFKKIVAVENEIVEVNESVYVNTHFVKNSSVQTYLPNGKKLTPCIGKHYLKKNEFFVMSDFNAQSFDSRYFCEINRENILGIVEKLAF